jgi:hypothetical protein
MAPLILVAGSIAASYRNGGIAWERLSWALGLRRLGLDVFIVDQLDRGRCVYPSGVDQVPENCLNLSWFEAVIEKFELAGRAAVIGERGESLYGPGPAELLELADEAVMLVNVAGNLRFEELKQRFRRRVYVDVDPGFTQLWLASGEPAPRIEGHDLHFTIGENVGMPGCPLPTGGIRWLHTRQPVLLDEWPVCADGDPQRFTTVARWRGVGPHGRLDRLGLPLGHKADEFAKVIELPRRAPQMFEIALGTDLEAGGRDLLERHGWRIAEAKSVAGDPASFRRYVQGSGGEFSVAKGPYVNTNTGWFSDRTTRYLSSGKPALVQDTGFGRTIPVGEGLLAFASLEQAVDGARRIAAAYEAPCEAARSLAEEHFHSDKVLAHFIDTVESYA